MASRTCAVAAPTAAATVRATHLGNGRRPLCAWLTSPSPDHYSAASMSVIAQAIADRQSEIDRLQAELKALTDVEEMPGSRGEQVRRQAGEEERRPMTAAEKKAVSERMTAYWAATQKQAAKK